MPQDYGWGIIPDEIVFDGRRIRVKIDDTNSCTFHIDKPGMETDEETGEEVFVPFESHVRFIKAGNDSGSHCVLDIRNLEPARARGKTQLEKGESFQAKQEIGRFYRSRAVDVRYTLYWDTRGRVNRDRKPNPVEFIYPPEEGDPSPKRTPEDLAPLQPHAMNLMRSYLSAANKAVEFS